MTTMGCAAPSAERLDFMAVVYHNLIRGMADLLRRPVTEEDLQHEGWLYLQYHMAGIRQISVPLMCRGR